MDSQTGTKLNSTDTYTEVHKAKSLEHKNTTQVISTDISF